MNTADHKMELKTENFPDNIRDLLSMLSGIDNHKITLILNTFEDCILEGITIVSLIGSLVLIRYGNKFKFIKIDCICSVIVDCDIILNEFIESCEK